MANSAVTQAASRTDTFRAAFSRWLETRAAKRAHRQAYLKVVSELRALSDRDLADLGLHRSMVKSIALEAADQKVRL